ncbi:MAG: saccharopine dehydrogenase NADP-binding domain-containing protein [Actinomycetota bacterium]|nr:saccharopine dehydrogenase NADP-binding domain-containing protein [Actinomycetota bacterium]
MPDILLFGATGYTGRLTARALARRGADFAIAGRSRAKLEALAEETGGPEARVAAVGDTDALVAALQDVRVLVTCVGPFLHLGDTAVAAALEAGCHYVDSTGEGPFIHRLIREHDSAARAAGIAMAPALGFDETPADLAATLAAEGLDKPDLVLTYALPSAPSSGTAKSIIDIATSRGPWIVDGAVVEVGPAEHERWAPMPPPLGPRLSSSFPLAEGHLAPLHLDLNGLRLFVTVDRGPALALKTIPLLRAAVALPGVRGGLATIIDRTVTDPEGERRQGLWTILAEARSKDRWRNVVLTGKDVYGITAETLSTAALRMSEPDFSESGVISPVQAVGKEKLQKELTEQGVSIQTYDS